jgi:integrase
MRARLTKTAVEALEPGSRDIYAWDDRVAGFGMKVTPKGARVYVLKYRAGRLQRWMTLGRHGEITAEQARAKAVMLRGAIAGGADPARDRNDGAAEPTVDNLADRYLEQYAAPHKKPRSVEEDERNLKLHVRPELGQMRVGDVARQDILKIHHRLRATPVAANRVTALLSKMFSLAEEWGIRPEGSNPARHIKKFAERSHKRFLSIGELQQLGKALTEAEAEDEQPIGIAIIRLLMLTGCRRAEILTLRWSFVDFDRSCLRLPDSKTGDKVVRLGAPALDLLADLPRFAHSPFVFPALRHTTPGGKRRVGAGHFVGIERVWSRVRNRAGIDDIRLHDLRHTYASWAVMGGMTLPMIGELLGHRQPSTTARYAHLADDPLRAAADRVAGTIASALNGGESAEIVEMPKAQGASCAKMFQSSAS